MWRHFLLFVVCGSLLYRSSSGATLNVVLGEAVAGASQGPTATSSSTNNTATTTTIIIDNARRIDSLPRCIQPSATLKDVDQSTVIDPCVLYDTLPTIDDHLQERTTIITVVGVFDTQCAVHRDGALVAVQALNDDHQGRGAALGYYQDHFVKFRLVVVVPGNQLNLAPELYATKHRAYLEQLVVELKPHYLLGTCSFDSELERDIAGRYRTMLLAQVGPTQFYTTHDNNTTSNQYMFGAHIPSEGYGIPAFQALRFDRPRRADRARQKIRIVYRDRSEFFRSTCRAVYDKALQEGFTDTVALEYNPNGDDDGDGVRNDEDVDFLQGLADQACGPAEEAQDDEGVALWGCFMDDFEVATVLDRWRDNGCRPSLLWLTKASTTWAVDHPSRIPYVQSGAQWHKSMAYADEYFPSSQAMLDHMTGQFGYTPDYGALGSYHAIYLMYQNIRSVFKGKDVPHVQDTFDQSYEEIRRSMHDLSLPHTLYGATAFDENQRNVGRGSAGMQWGIPANSNSNSSSDSDNDRQRQQQPPFVNLMVSPVEYATASVVFPAPAAQKCPAGTYVNASKVTLQADLLGRKCDACPVDTFAPTAQTASACRSCPTGSNTDGRTGATICVQRNDNWVSPRVHAFGYVLMALVFTLAVGFGIWTVVHKLDPVVRIGQMPFLLLICVGSVVSSSSIIPLSIQAGATDDETAAHRACMALPWLYTTGWMLQYGSLSLTSYRMYKTMTASANLQRVVVTARDMYKILAVLLAVNWAVLIPWTVLDPLTWTRIEEGITVDEDLGVMTYESYGRCSSEHLKYWAGPVLSFHLLIMLVTNVILYNIRNISDRYQESKYVAMASFYACEMLVVGIPIVIAVGASTEASYIVLACVVGMGDLGILLMIFVPKLLYQRQGLPEGQSVGKSLLKHSQKPTNSRQSFNASSSNSLGRNNNGLIDAVSTPFGAPARGEVCHTCGHCAVPAIAMEELTSSPDAQELPSNPTENPISPSPDEEA